MHDMVPADPVDGLAARAETIVTDDGNGPVTWRAWGSGPVLLLLHGDYGSWTHFARNIDALAARFRVYAPDMPGYGDSATPPPPHAPWRLAAALAAGVDRLIGGARFDIVGFSYGGIVAGHLAAARPDRVGRLVLSGPGGFDLAGNGTPPAGLLRVREGMTQAETDAVHRHNLARVMIADPARVDDLAVRIQRDNIARARVRAGSYPDGDSLLRALESVRARLAGIWGECDSFCNADRRAQVHRLLRGFDPDVDFRVVPGAGHWLFHECPDIANRLLTEMLDR
ncbi:MAG: alpha/beta fold hydrolase [Pseudomonadota bacterium]|nr:alpha/beta fold hydrolase [Pseudomonadota bacterium]